MELGTNTPELRRKQPLWLYLLLHDRPRHLQEDFPGKGMCLRAGPAPWGGSWVQDSGWPWAGGHPQGWLRGPCLLRGCLGRAWPPLGIVCGVGVSGRALGEGRQAGGSCIYRVSAFPGLCHPHGLPLAAPAEQETHGFGACSGAGLGFCAPNPTGGVGGTRGRAHPLPKRQLCQQGACPAGEKTRKNPRSLLSPLPPSGSLPGLGAQQPLFLRMKAWPRTACCISVKARVPTVTWQGPSAWKPHFS